MSGRSRGRGPGRSLVLAALAAASAAGAPASAVADEPRQFVLSPEGNHLWAYDAASGDAQLVVRAQNGDDPGADAPNGLRRDVNGQVCVSPDGTHVVAGEDTVVAPPGSAPGGDGAGSHDPRVAGWGWFRIEGAELGSISVEQTGKLAPEAGGGPGYAGDPDNYGCAFLDDDRLLTTAIGDRFPGQPANGQLFLWFGPFERGFRQATDPATGAGFFVGEVPHCEIDGGLATAAGIAVAPGGDVLVAANRPTEVPGGDPAAVWRYRGRWPATPDECTAEFLAANLAKTAVVPSLPGLPADPKAPTPSGVLALDDGGLVVSSVFSGTVAEFDETGRWVRDLFPTSPLAVAAPPTGDTPYGLARTADGAIWIADLGIVGADAAAGEGSVRRIPFDGGRPGAAEVVADGLDFPDGLGVYTATGAAAPPGPSTTSGAALPRTGGGPGPWPVGGAALLVAAAGTLRRVRR